MSESYDEVAGLVDVVAQEQHVLPAPVETPKEPDTETAVEDEIGDDTQDFSRQPIADKETDTDVEEKKEEVAEESKEETVTEETVETDWKTTLPPPPAQANIVEPVLDEDGNITNMSPQQYTQYTVELAKAQMREELYNQTVETRALDAAEQILPELKTDQGLQQMVQNIRVASVLSGTQVDTVEAAKQVKAILSQYKAQGAQNAKVSITTQKAASLQTNGSSQVTPSKTADRGLQTRLAKGDTDAFAELFDTWQVEGKL